MEKTTLLQEILNDISQRCLIPSTYNLVKISGLIRQLLFDTKSLIPSAQKETGKIFKFRVNGDSIKETVEFHSTLGPLQGLSLFAGELDNHIDKKDILYDEYGKIPVIYSGGKYFNIKDVIRYVANKRGGIHYDETLENEQQILDDLSKHFFIGNVESVFNQVFSIGRNIINSARASGYF